MESLLLVHLDETAWSPDELNEATLRLRTELLELGVERAEVPRFAPPERAKGDAFTYGALAIAVLPTLMPKLVDFLRHWAGRSSRGRLRVSVRNGDKVVEVEVDGSSTSAERLLHTASRALEAQRGKLAR
jgi:hypothetical protein